MPAQIPRPEIMDEDQLMKEVLDKFINCPEQTYEEFLSTFTHLSKENNVARRGACGTDLSENIFTTKKLTHIKESHDHHFRNRAVVPHTSSECSEDDQIVIDEGQQVGSSLQGDMTQAGKVKVDNFLDLEDLDMEEQSEPQMNTGKQVKTRQMEHLPALFSYISGGGVRPGRTTTSLSKPRGLRPGRNTTSLSKPRGVRLEGSSLPMPSSNLPDELQPCNMLRNQYTDRLLLPGEVEQDISASVPAYVPSVNLPLTSEVKPKPTERRTLKQMEEIFGDEVQPFFLDEEFDYDNVTLTPKFTAGEIATIQELAKKRTMDSNTDFCEHHD